MVQRTFHRTNPTNKTIEPIEHLGSNQQNQSDQFQHSWFQPTKPIGPIHILVPPIKTIEPMNILVSTNKPLNKLNILFGALFQPEPRTCSLQPSITTVNREPETMNQFSNRPAPAFLLVQNLRPTPWFLWNVRASGKQDIIVTGIKKCCDWRI